jgi:hypothetical protein
MSDPFEQLPESHLACLRLVARGRQTKEIAQELGLAPNTVDTYLRATIRALGVQTRFQAARHLAMQESGASQRLRYQPETIAPLPIPDIPQASLNDRENRPPSVVRENMASFGYPSPLDRPGWIVRFSEYLGGAWNDLTEPQRLIWIVLATFVIVVIAFLTFAAVESVQTTLLLLSNSN